jgi:hypothetical protein
MFCTPLFIKLIIFMSQQRYYLNQLAITALILAFSFLAN